MANIILPVTQKIPDADCAAWMRGESPGLTTAVAALVQIAGDTSRLKHSFDISANVDPSVTIMMLVEVSEDGGLTWQQAGAISIVGGMYPDFNAPAGAKEIYSLDGGKSWAPYSPDAEGQRGVLFSARNLAQNYWHGDRAEGFFSEDGGASWFSMVSLAPDKYLSLAASPTVIYERRDKPYKSPLVRKSFLISGNAAPFVLASTTEAA